MPIRLVDGTNNTHTFHVKKKSCEGWHSLMKVWWKWDGAEKELWFYKHNAAEVKLQSLQEYFNVWVKPMDSFTRISSASSKHDGGGRLTSVVRERSAPAVSSTRTQSSLPASQASKRGVWPSAVGASTAAPAARSTSTQLEEERGEGAVCTNSMFGGLHSNRIAYLRCI